MPTNKGSTEIGIQFIGSGSKGNSALLKIGDAFFLLDAGLSARQILSHLQELNIAVEDIRGIIISHGHGDHIRGLKTLRKKIRCPIYCTYGTLRELDAAGISSGESCLLKPGKEFELNGARFWPFRVPHDALEPLGFRIEFECKTLAVATDLGHISPEVFSHLIDCDILCIESNYDEKMLSECRYPGWLKNRIKGPLGHLSNNGFRGILARQKKKLFHLFLVHLSQESNSPELVRKNLNTMLLSSTRQIIPATIAAQETPTHWINCPG